MGLIDFNFYSGAPVASTLEMITSCASAAGAVSAFYWAYKAYKQNQQIKLDSVIPHCNIVFSITKEHIHVTIENTGLGPLILNDDPVFTFNRLPLKPTQKYLNYLLFQDGLPYCVKEAKFIMRSLHRNDSLSVRDKLLLIEYTFNGSLSDLDFESLKREFLAIKISLKINYRSIYNVNLQAERTYEDSV